MDDMIQQDFQVNVPDASFYAAIDIEREMTGLADLEVFYSKSGAVMLVRESWQGSSVAAEVRPSGEVFYWTMDEVTP